MNNLHDDDALEATHEQLMMLRDFGVSDTELEDLSFADAEEWIAELRVMHENADRIGRE